MDKINIVVTGEVTLRAELCTIDWTLPSIRAQSINNKPSDHPNGPVQ